MSTKRQSATKLSNAKSADSADILDTNEQEKVVDELRLEAQRQTDKARSMFQVLLWTAAVGFAGCFISGFWAPWAMDHEYVFRSLIPYELFQVYYFGSAITFSILAVIVKVHQCISDRSIFCLLNLLSFLYFYRNHHKKFQNGNSLYQSQELYCHLSCGEQYSTSTL